MRTFSKIFLISCALIIFFTGTMSFWYFRKFQKVTSEINIPNLELPKFEQKVEEVEWTAPDGKIKLKYFSDWNKIKEEVGKFLTFQSGEILLAAYKIKIEKFSMGFLTVGKYKIEEEKTIKDFTERIKKTAKEKDMEIEIVNSEIEEGTGWWEIKYRREGDVRHGKEKFFLVEDKIYVVSLFTLEKDWSDFKEEANLILNSAKVY